MYFFLVRKKVVNPTHPLTFCSNHLNYYVIMLLQLIGNRRVRRRFWETIIRVAITIRYFSKCIIVLRFGIFTQLNTLSVFFFWIKKYIQVYLESLLNLYFNIAKVPTVHGDLYFTWNTCLVQNIYKMHSHLLRFESSFDWKLQVFTGFIDE